MNVEESLKKKHYTMQMIWLLGATVPAKKVHFNLNGSELRGFPIKARSGQSSILYANPLAPKAVACFCLCPAVITGGQCAHGGCLSNCAVLTPLSTPHPFLSNTQWACRHREKNSHTHTRVRSHKLWHEHFVWSYYFPECVIPIFLMVSRDLSAHTIPGTVTSTG